MLRSLHEYHDNIAASGFFMVLASSLAMDELRPDSSQRTMLRVNTRRLITPSLTQEELSQGRAILDGDTQLR